MELSSFLYNDKILDAIAIGLKPNVTLHVHEGAIRSSKTVTAIQEFFEAVQRSDKALHAICCQDKDAISDTILYSDGFGLLELYPQYCILRKDKIGGFFVDVTCDLPNVPSSKKILLTNYSDKSKWKKILGKTLGVVLVDEVNNANKQFIDELFARSVSVDKPLMIWTLNGDQPQHYIYTDYINRCKIVGDCPISIQRDMKQYEKENGWFYQHWTMKNNPVMTPDKIDRAERLYPKGSYYYTCKILGERGSWGKLIYNDYLDREKHIKDVANYFDTFVVGVDIGATKAKNSISLVGFKKGYSEAGVVDKYTFQQCGYKQKQEIILATVLNWKQKYNIECIAVDSAEQNFIIDLNSHFKRYRLQVIPSYKATIKQRIDLVISLLSWDRFCFNNTVEGKKAYDAFLIAKWSEGKEGLEREDNNEEHNDIIDSIEYALTTKMASLLMFIQRNKEKE